MAKTTAGCCYNPERSSVSFRFQPADYFPNLPNLPLAADLHVRNALFGWFHAGGLMMRCRIPGAHGRGR